MILYFSATGNSLLVARAIQEATGDEMVPILDYIKGGIYEIRSERPVVIVSPIHVWIVPQFITKYLEKATLVGTDKIYFVVTCRREAGNTDQSLDKLCKDKGWDLRGIGVVRMPFNYIMGNEVDEPPLAKKIIKESAPNIRYIAKAIADGEHVEYTAGRTGYKVTMFSFLYRTYYVNGGKFMVNKKRCIHCGKCAENCPVGAITMKNGCPSWKYMCKHCTACINNCPVKAIDHGQMTKGMLRYTCPYSTVEEAENDDSVELDTFFTMSEEEST